MKPVRSYICSLLILTLLASTGILQAQNYIGDDANVVEQSVTTGAVNPILDNPATPVVADSNIFINQIGDSNVIEVRNQLDGPSDLEIAQLGDQNLVYLSVQARALIQNILQEGDGHEVLNFSSNRELQNLEIVQRGSDQNVIFHGTNSISEKMKINMEGNSQSIIVRSFN